VADALGPLSSPKDPSPQAFPLRIGDRGHEDLGIGPQAGMDPKIPGEDRQSRRGSTGHFPKLLGIRGRSDLGGCLFREQSPHLLDAAGMRVYD
jgi:hypothetical protein